MAAIAASYDPARHEAPIVVGHPTTDAPAYGWIAALAADADGLHGTPHQVNPAFAEAVRAGQYKKISVSLYAPGNAANPTPENWHLKHVGFLGAKAPAVKGLREARLAENDGAVMLEFALAEADISSHVVGGIGRLFRSLREWLIGEHDIETADKILPAWDIESLEEEEGRLRAAQSEASHFSEAAAPGALFDDKEVPDMDKTELDKTAELAEREARLETRERKAQAKEVTLAAAEAEARQQAAAEFAEELAAEGKILPRDQQAIAELLTALPDDAAVHFAEGEGDAPSEGAASAFLRQFLSRLPVQVEFAERTGANDTSALPATLALPAGWTLDPAAQALHEKVVAFAEARDVPYEEALSAVSHAAH